jgi:hypothetical protein
MRVTSSSQVERLLGVVWYAAALLVWALAVGALGALLAFGLILVFT